ncbi:hypothetical protein BGW36DRAFT_378045 [Talaromyces proteolyticus]|uniref:Uncharacterized protein n=1 Tax=Talaromyces proteolyticus TaxID=1131652 RepID=A0AAD4KR09_9EURO|nr:uncharacterized protein BGW36DRAFT_378045 [Talaromyces proteolyticus]KAH8697138.1 hypothetical protein BGW36DRAFT_378045 [Talaromyces proteolyticus]
MVYLRNCRVYSVYLPYRFGLRNRDYLCKKLNSALLAYGTSPLTGMDATDAQKELYDDWYAEKIPYIRRFAYLLAIDNRSRKVTGRFGLQTKQSFGRYCSRHVLPSYRGDILQARGWLAYLYPYLGDNIFGAFEGMLRDKVPDLSDTYHNNE